MDHSHVELQLLSMLKIYPGKTTYEGFLLRYNNCYVSCFLARIFFFVESSMCALYERSG